MFELVKNIFRKESPTVTVGAEYVLRKGGNPFAKDVRVQVKDFKDGYVLYAMYPYNDGIFQNESMDIERFLGVYERIL
jgi:hypothetical protein